MGRESHLDEQRACCSDSLLSILFLSWHKNVCPMAHFLILIDCQINSPKVLADKGLVLTSWFCVFLYIFTYFILFTYCNNPMKYFLLHHKAMESNAQRLFIQDPTVKCNPSLFILMHIMSSPSSDYSQGSFYFRGDIKPWNEAIVIEN